MLTYVYIDKGVDPDVHMKTASTTYMYVYYMCV